MEGVEDKRQVAVPELARPLLVADTDGRELFEQERQVVSDQISADCARGPDAIEDSLREVV